MGALTIKGMAFGEGMPKTVVSLMGANPDELRKQVERALAAGVDCLEYRADHASDPRDTCGIVATARALAELLPQNPLLFTFRTEGQGGQKRLDAVELEALYRAVIADGSADLIDIESWIGDDMVRTVCASAHEAGIAAVVSFHDFSGTPPRDDMVAMMLHFRELGADIPKVAAMANRTRDVRALMDATDQARRTDEAGPLLTMAMGALGSITRVAGESFGSALTFCAIDEPSAPGQLKIAQAKAMMQLLHGTASGRPRLITLLGNPTGHSLSPVIHNLSFQLLGIDSVYRCLDVYPGELATVIDVFRAMDGWDGGNVTMPCKQAVIPHLDSLDETAELVGAVNVLKKHGDGSIVGHNTDGVGLTTDLHKHGVQVRGSHLVLLGVGGAGSSILAQAALDGVERIDAFVRGDGKSYRYAESLISRVMERTNCDIRLNAFADDENMRSCIKDANILVNATPVGMGEGDGSTLVPPELMHPDLTVADIIYHPRETQLMIDAKARGCKTIGGIGMLVEQAAASEAIWYGVEMPVNEIRQRLYSS